VRGAKERRVADDGVGLRPRRSQGVLAANAVERQQGQRRLGLAVELDPLPVAHPEHDPRDEHRGAFDVDALHVGERHVRASPGEVVASMRARHGGPISQRRS